MMESTMDYLDKLRQDLLEQFRGKPNIEVFQKALARQLSALYEFFYQLHTLRWLQTAQGTQLDGIGDIVCLSRAEALVLSQLAGQNVPMNDETYRRYLIFKIHLNTSDCTHRDVYNALKMFWNKPLYYHEDPDYPATMFFETSILSPEDNVGALFLAPKVKAAGVALHLSAVTQTPTMPTMLYLTSAVPATVMTTILPEPQPGTFETAVNPISGATSIESTQLPKIESVLGQAFRRDVETGVVSPLYAYDGNRTEPAYIRVIEYKLLPVLDDLPRPAFIQDPTTGKTSPLYIYDGEKIEPAIIQAVQERRL